jgi:hypothetical protein
MKKTEFIQFITDVAKEYGTVETQEVVKPDVTYTGLYVKRNGASPVVNVDALWNDYCNETLSLNEVEDMVKEILTSEPPKLDPTWITDWEKARRRLTIRVFEENPGGLYDEFRGAYFCPYINVIEGGGVRVTQEILAMWEDAGVRRDTVFATAAMNTALNMVEDLE